MKTNVVYYSYQTSIREFRRVFRINAVEFILKIFEVIVPKLKKKLSQG